MTTQASIDAAVYQVTEWALPRSPILIGTGPTIYEVWLQIEVDRFKEKWTEAWVKTDEHGMIALFTWAGKQLPVDGEDSKE
jgi:hypothetical protein